MISTRWRKVWLDLWENKSRTFLVVLSVAVGVLATGAIGGTREIILRDMTAGYAAIHPANAILEAEPFGDDLISAVRNVPGVLAAEGRYNLPVRLKVGPDQWDELLLTVIPNFIDMRINQIKPVAGAWPPAAGDVILERTALGMVGGNIGDTVLIQLGNGSQKELHITGTAHDQTHLSARFEGRATGYITPATLEKLGQPSQYEQLLIRVGENAQDRNHAQEVALRVRSEVERFGRSVISTYVPEPGKNPADQTVQPIIIILGVLGLMSLLASGFLVINTMRAVMAQQVRQIGVMKAIGASTAQIAGMYLTVVAGYALLALALAIPLGTLAARWASQYLASLLNFDLTGYGVSPGVLAAQVTVGLIMPLAAALVPVISGTRVTVHQAISNFGGEQTSSGKTPNAWLDRITFLSRTLLLSLRHTLQRPIRLALTLITLTLGGAIFVAVLSVRASLLLTLDDALKYWNFDVQVETGRPYPSQQLADEAQRLPEVAKAEVWSFSTARRIRPDGTESQTILMTGPPSDSTVVEPIMVEGRWLLSSDENAIVVNTELLQNEDDLHVGDQAILKLGKEEIRFQVVGIVQGIMSEPTAYLNYEYLSTKSLGRGMANTLMVVTKEHGPESEAAVEKAIKDRFKESGIDVRRTKTMTAHRDNLAFRFGVLVNFLLMVAVLLAIVGGLGLMGTMSISVLERTREIGVLRAIGASNASVLQLVLSEGLIISLMSWLLGSLAAVPLSMLLSHAVGEATIGAGLSYTFAPWSIVLSLGLTSTISVIASLLPAIRATQLSVRNVLAYE